MMKVMNERTLNSASSMKNPLSAPARGIAFQRAILRRCGVPMYGANLLYPLSVPVYSPPSVRRGRPSRRGYPKGRHTKRQPHPEKKGVRLPSRLVPGGRIGGGLYQRTGSLVDPFGKGGVGVDGFEEIAAVQPRWMARVASAIRSEAWAPAMCAPRSLPLPSSTTSLNSPASSPMACALPSSRNWNTEVFTANPCCLACASESPTSPISGAVKMAEGTTS